MRVLLVCLLFLFPLYWGCEEHPRSDCEVVFISGPTGGINQQIATAEFTFSVIQPSDADPDNSPLYSESCLNYYGWNLYLPGPNDLGISFMDTAVSYDGYCVSNDTTDTIRFIFDAGEGQFIQGELKAIVSLSGDCTGEIDQSYFEVSGHYFVE